MNIIESNLRFRYALTKRFQTNKIVLHHAKSSNCTIQDIHNWHLQNDNGTWAGCGYHFFVRKDGTVYRGRPIDTIGSHCKGVNGESIGICAEGNYMNEYMPDIQKHAIIELIKEIKKIYPNTTIGGHKDFSPSECPGINYPLSEVIKLANEQPKHFAYDSFKYLKDNGIIINEERFEDGIKRGEIFVLLAQIVKLIIKLTGGAK